MRPQADFDNAYHRCVMLAKMHERRAHIIKEDSVLAASRFKDYSIDLVFIDGDHSYEGCNRDICAWLPKVKVGGLIGGHDYNHPLQGNVKKAVDEFFPQPKIQLGENRTWFVRI
jgi:predicted O-methyltransferase YrrM